MKFDPPFEFARAFRGLTELDEIAGDPSMDEHLLSCGFDTYVQDIVWMLSQVAPELEVEFRALLLAKLSTRWREKKNKEIPESIRADIQTWRAAYHRHPYIADPRVQRTFKRTKGPNKSSHPTRG
ncbi:MAG TPA: hypothetical protein VHD32_01660 [Candidatus Didemnitutus sp.]|nr:hypothetical protein [Candidatus Didemnitutus sp.]